MSLFFDYSKAIIAHLKHVRIVPTTWASTLRMLIIYPEVIDNAVPIAPNIAGSAPTISSGISPFPYIFLPPTAYGVEDWSASSIKCISHGSVPLLTRETQVIAIIIL